jgi:hypothetical protein
MQHIPQTQWSKLPTPAVFFEEKVMAKACRGQGKIFWQSFE